MCDRGDPYAAILRMKPDGSGQEVFARGVRNTVGFDWHPSTRELWFTDNGRDNLGDNTPGDELNRAPKAGMHFGYPYCHEGTIVDPEFGAKRQCSEFEPPAQRLEPHAGAIGMRFYTGSQFPQQYRNQIFIAEHGSWNRSAWTGVQRQPHRDRTPAGQQGRARTSRSRRDGWKAAIDGAARPIWK